MIRRGKREGWLNLPPSAVRPWAGLNGVTFDGVKIGSIAGRGTGVVASRVLKGGNEGPLMVIPGDLILSLERVELQAKSDQKLQELLSTLGDYARTTRGAILVFLLRQATIANPQVTETIGTINPFTEYIKFLPEEMLPTFWTEEERALLMGTSLHPALEAKLTSLQKEFDNVRTATENIPWCSKYWWGVGTGLLSFDDWLQVDAMYRSRALEFPGIGDSMVPCIDMANHASGDGTAALYETDGHGNGVLLLRDGSDLTEGQEVTITYGDAKGACEMMFSYGFLEEGVSSARELFLDLQIPNDDPLALAKKRVSTSAPGIKIYEDGDEVQWYSDFLYLVCVNEEDGLDFRLLQTNDGDREIQAQWKGSDLHDPSKLQEVLQKDTMWEVFQLRAIALVQQRVEEQLQLLVDTTDVVILETGNDRPVRDGPRHLATQLRKLERTLLEKAFKNLEHEKLALFETEIVRDYLSAQAGEAAEQDFT